MTIPGELVELGRRFQAMTPDQREATLAGMTEQQRAALVQAIQSNPLLRASIGATAKLTERQMEAEALLNSAATHCMLFGGSRSGKTFLICRHLAGRAIEVPSRHAILRFRFAHLHSSIIEDTWPKMLSLCYPGAAGKMDRQLWVYRFENGSEVWFGGLDEKDRTEKILGSEFASIFLNECSQIALSSRKIAVTRLAQNVGLPLKMYHDCNPSSRRHWSHLYFVDKIDPDRHQPLPSPNNYVSLQLNPKHNAAHLPPGYIEELDQLDERRRQRFLLGVFADDDDSALWTPELLDRSRLLTTAPPAMQKIVIGVDPSGCSGPADLRSDEVGIVVAGLGVDGRGYILEDLSGRHALATWKEIVASAYNRHKANVVVCERNFGGDLVIEVLRTAVADGGLPLAVRPVDASRGKHVRAEPYSALWSQNRVCLVGRFEHLENQLLAMTSAGYMGDRSPDRLDAMVWSLRELFPAMAREAREAATDQDGPRRHREIRVHTSTGSYWLRPRDPVVKYTGAPPPPPPPPAPPPVGTPWPEGVTRKRWNPVTGKLEIPEQ
jgi:hypothetical protein